MERAENTPAGERSQGPAADRAPASGAAWFDPRPAGVKQCKPTEAGAQSPRSAAQPDLMTTVQNSSRMVAQRQRIADAFGPTIQFDEAPAGPNRTGLPDGLKSGIEALSGMSLDSVKVHYNSARPAQLSALAYAQGTDIHVAPGHEEHLPHEAWHVVQQAQGRVQPTMQTKDGTPVNDNKGLEQEADVMGARALSAPVRFEGGPIQRRGLDKEQPSRMPATDRGIVQRVKFNEHTHKEMSTSELMGDEKFMANKAVRAYIVRFKESALRALLDSWAEHTFHNMPALTSRVNGELLAFKEKAQKERAEVEAPEIEERKKRYQAGDAAEWLSGWSGFAEEWALLSPILTPIVGGVSADRVCRRLALVAMFDAPTARFFRDRVMRLAEKKTGGAPIDWPGIVKTLEMVTGALPGEPKDYSPFGGKHFDDFYGVTKQGGIPLSFKGITSELDAILSIDSRELAAGEVVFSGSNYLDPARREMTKNVDVSYIDSAGVLHLIENGKDMNTLRNKVVGTHDQKSIYRHLVNEAGSLEHTPVGPLTAEQATRNQITGVQWWYSVPPEAMTGGIDDTVKATLRAIAAAGAGLRCGAKRLLPQALRELAQPGVLA